jgi:hypothetical protein
VHLGRAHAAVRLHFLGKARRGVPVEPDLVTRQRLRALGYVD